MISIYQNHSGFRVVSGKHLVAAEHKGLQPRMYDTLRDAYAVETDSAIRGALVRMDASVLEVQPTAMHHVKRAQAGNASLVLLAVIAFFLLMPVCGGFYHVHFQSHDLGALAVLAFIVLLVKAVKS